jgi:outer membrane protein insertion porin family
MDVAYSIEEGDKSYIEKIVIKGNNKTRDRVLRRELAVAPGETFDMVRVKRSKDRLQQLDYFGKVDAQPEDTDVPNRKNLVIGVDEKSTGNMMVGAGFSSVDSLMGFVEVSQNNFDLFAPPTFTGDGQKARMRAQIGTEQQVYEISFVEPWFFGRKLMFGVDLFYRDLGYVSLNDIYDEIDAGGTLSLTRALGSENLIGRVAYTLEDVDISINSGYHVNEYVKKDGSIGEPNISQEIYQERGARVVSKIAPSLAYDTRNSVQLPNHGQRTELFTELAGLGGDSDFYKLEIRSHWYFKGFADGHIIEVAGATGVSDVWGDTPRVPIFDRWYLGGMYSLRGFRYREVGPKDKFGEPLGGNTYWFGSLEYSVPVIDRVRAATFYDIGNVFAEPYSFSPGKTPAGKDRVTYSDDAGVGLRINLPMIGPLRLDYGFPFSHDPNTSATGRFQFGVGFERPF